MKTNANTRTYVHEQQHAVSNGPRHEKTYLRVSDQVMLKQSHARIQNFLSEGVQISFSYFLPLFDRPKINIVFSNTLKARSCIANQVHNSKTTL